MVNAATDEITLDRKIDTGPDVNMANSAMAVGDGIMATNTRWTFAGSTPDHFNQHVNRSIPLYAEGHDLICGLIDFFSRPKATIVDVGCSTGTLLAKLAQKPNLGDTQLVGMDIEADMVRTARRTCAEFSNVEIRQGDAINAPYENSSAVIMYYTLQFVPKGDRRPIMQRVFDGLRPGGALLLFEKTLCANVRLQDMLNQLYMDFKQRNGFDTEEIYNKTRSLRSVMEPQLSEDNHAMLHDVGFRGIATVQKSLIFEGILAVK
jgi:tRNA (cmo5U34)-methyltransferase